VKTLTAAAALDKGVVTPATTYFDPSFIKVDDATIKNIEEDGGPGTRSVKDILTLSLNTGAVWLLKQLGGGDINSRARETWHDYLVNHYHFGSKTGIEQAGEVAGYIPDPEKGNGLDVQYANMAFGQGMTMTPIQLAAAVSSLVNGGTYYKPHVVESLVDQSGTVRPTGPEKTGSAVSAAVSEQMRGLMEKVVDFNISPPFRSGYSIGGKTGTAQIASPEGGYYDDKFNGTYVGFVGGDAAQYVVVVRVNEPTIKGYAGSRAAAPVFVDTINTLLDNYGILPKH
jgi:cell division protein FtsI/penicillin-binding protein 2